MSSKKKELRAFDDFLYSGLDYIKSNNLSLPVELLKTDDLFLSQVFELYNIIEEEQVTILNCPQNTGITTALYFVMCYYSLTYPIITILSKAGKARNQTMDKVFDLFKKFTGEDYSHELKSNTVIISKGQTKISEIKFMDAGTFDIALVSNILLFDDCNKLKNLDKYTDLMKSRARHDKIVMNFADSPELTTLANENKIIKKDFKIF